MSCFDVVVRDEAAVLGFVPDVAGLDLRAGGLALNVDVCAAGVGPDHGGGGGRGRAAVENVGIDREVHCEL